MSKIAKATIGLMIVTIISKVLGFGRELVLAGVYGVSAYSDAYLVALNIPIIIFESIGLSVATTFIPLYYENEKNGGKLLANKFTNNIYNIIFIITIAISLIIFLFADEVVRIFAVGFEGETFKIAVDFTKILIFGIIFIAMSNITRAFLNANGNFTISNLMMGIPYNIIVIITIILSSKTNPYLLAYGTLIGIASKFIFQIPYTKKYEYRYKFKIDIKDESLKKMIWLVAPVFIGVAVNQINAIIDRSVASTLVEGSISALNYSNRLNQFVMALFIASIASVIYPTLAKYSINENIDKFKNSVVSSINIVTIIVIPISVGAIVLAQPIVRVLFERGAFDEIATKMTSSAFVYYSIGMIAFGLRDILNKVFYSLQDTKTPMINGAFAMVINIILNFILVKFMNHNGLALATSISSILCTIMLFSSLNKKIGDLGMKKIFKNLLKSIIAAFIMGYLTFNLYNILGYAIQIEIVRLIISVMIGAMIYILLLLILKNDELNIFINTVKKKLKK